MAKPYQQVVFFIVILLVVSLGFSYLNRSFMEKLETTKKDLGQLITERIKAEPASPATAEKGKPLTLPEHYVEQVKSLEAKLMMLDQRLTEIDNKLDQLSSATLMAAGPAPLAGFNREKLATLMDDLNVLRAHIGPVSSMAERTNQRIQQWEERRDYWRELSGQVKQDTIEAAGKGLGAALEVVEGALDGVDLSTARDEDIAEALKAKLRGLELEGDCQINVMKRDGTLLYHDRDRLIGRNVLDYRDAFQNPVWPQILEKEQGTIAWVDRIRWNTAQNNVAQFLYYEPLDAWIIARSYEQQYRAPQQ